MVDINYLRKRSYCQNQSQDIETINGSKEQRVH